MVRWYTSAMLMCIAMMQSSPTIAAQAKVKQIPAEYESVGGHGLGLGNVGAATMVDVSSVRVNPAMLALEKQYQLYGGYNWPGQGREFYQVGIIDSKTSSFAAGVTYTGYTDDYRYRDEPARSEGIDSPVVRRGVVGVAKTLSTFSVGIGGHYVEGEGLAPDRETGQKIGRTNGIGLSGGIAALLTPKVRVGASAENVSNKTIADYAPLTYRAGLAYIMGDGNVIASLDFRQRDRVGYFEGTVVDPLNPNDKEDDLMKSPERMGFASVTARVQNFLRVLGSYGQSLSDERRTLSGGVAVVQDKFSLSYSISKPHLRQDSLHQAVNLALDMAM